LEIIVFVFIFIFFKNPSIFDLINLIKENPEKKEEFEPIIEKELRKIYKITSGEQSSSNYLKLRLEIEKGMIKTVEKVSLSSAFCSKKYRRASCNAILLAII
jgi:hypothetical protein